MTSCTDTGAALGLRGGSRFQLVEHHKLYSRHVRSYFSAILWCSARRPCRTTRPEVHAVLLGLVLCLAVLCIGVYLIAVEAAPSPRASVSALRWTLCTDAAKEQHYALSYTARAPIADEVGRA